MLEINSDIYNESSHRAQYKGTVYDIRSNDSLKEYYKSKKRIKHEISELEDRMLLLETVFPHFNKSIFFDYPNTTYKILFEVGKQVKKLDLPTSIPEQIKKFGPLDEVDSFNYIFSILSNESKYISRNNTIFLCWWIIASEKWMFRGEDYDEQKCCLKSFLSYIYGIPVSGAYPISYEADIPEILTESASGVYVKFRKPDGEILIPDDGFGLIAYIELFMLVSAIMNLTEVSDPHIFSTKCRCTVCLESPEYIKLLNPELSNLKEKPPCEKENFIFIDSGFVEKIVTRLVSIKDDFIPGVHPVFIYNKGAVVNLEDDDTRSNLLKIIKYSGNDRSGVLYKVDKACQERLDLIIESCRLKIRFCKDISKYNDPIIINDDENIVWIVKCHTKPTINIFENWHNPT